MKRTVLSKAAGWVLSVLGGAHMVVASFDTKATWRQVAAEGWWKTFTLDRADSIPDLRRSETFWSTTGSFGVPFLALGTYILWSVRRHARIPSWLGWSLLAYGMLAGILLPISPVWAVVVAGVLIVLGDQQTRAPGAGVGELPEVTR